MQSPKNNQRGPLFERPAFTPTPKPTPAGLDTRRGFPPLAQSQRHICPPSMRKRERKRESGEGESPTVPERRHAGSRMLKPLCTGHPSCGVTHRGAGPGTAHVDRAASDGGVCVWGGGGQSPKRELNNCTADPTNPLFLAGLLGCFLGGDDLSRPSARGRSSSRKPARSSLTGKSERSQPFHLSPQARVFFL